jgi:hypothetical protein
MVLVLAADSVLPNVAHLILYYLFPSAVLMWSEFLHSLIPTGEINAISAM